MLFFTKHRFISKKIGVLLVFFLYAFVGYSQSIQYSLHSPRRTAETHLQNLHSENFYPKIASRVFRTTGNYSQKELSERAIALKRIFDGLGIYVHLEKIPDTPNYQDSLSGKNRYILDKTHPKIYLEKIGRRWYYSQETFELIPALYEQTYPFGTHRFLEITERFSDETYFGLKAWQYVGLLVVLLTALLFYQILVFINRRIVVKILNKVKLDNLSENFFTPITRPFSLLLDLVFVMLAIRVMQLPSLLNYYIQLGLKASLPFLATIIVYRFVDLIASYLQKAAQKSESMLDDQLVPLFRKVTKILVVIFGTLIVIQNLRFDITGLVAGISIGGLAFALAAQDTIKNLFGSLMILIDKPFKVGDYIKTTDIEGDVEEIGFRSTRVRSLYNSLIYVPNGKMADMTIDNLGMRDYKRFRTFISLTYDTPPELIAIFVEGLQKIVEQHPQSRPDYKEIHLHEFGASAYQILFQMYIVAKEWGDELAVRHDIMLQIVRLANALQVRLAFPTSTLHVESFPQKTGLSPEYLSEADYRKRLEDFFGNKKLD